MPFSSVFPGFPPVLLGTAAVVQGPRVVVWDFGSSKKKGLLGSQAFVKCTHAIHAFLQCFSRISSGYARYFCGCPGAPWCCLGFGNFEENLLTRLPDCQRNLRTH